MTKENIYYFCTSCGHVHLRNSEIGKLHIQNSYKTQKHKKEMEFADKGIENILDSKLEKKIIEKKIKRMNRNK